MKAYVKDSRGIMYLTSDLTPEEKENIRRSEVRVQQFAKQLERKRLAEQLNQYYSHIIEKK